SALAAAHQHRDRRAHAGTAQREAQIIWLCRGKFTQVLAARGAQGHASGAGRASAQRTYGRGAKPARRFLRAAALGAEGRIRCARAQTFEQGLERCTKETLRVPRRDDYQSIAGMAYCLGMLAVFTSSRL